MHAGARVQRPFARSGNLDVQLIFHLEGFSVKGERANTGEPASRLPGPKLVRTRP